MRYYERERREFVRVKVEVPVRYRFLSHDPSFEFPGFLTGTTRDVSGGGILLDAQVPDADWIPALLTGRIFIGIELDLPGGGDPPAGGGPSAKREPVRALTRAAWVQAAVQGEGDNCLMGLRFREITRDGLDRVFRFVIEKQMT